MDIWDYAADKEWTYRYSSAQRRKYVNKIVTVAVVKQTTPAVRARKPKA